MPQIIEIEAHPLQPFLPSNAQILMLGSFPPQKRRWSMDFYYPNLQNDMWRIFGLIFFNDKDHFLTPNKKAFNKERLIDFLTEKGIALYDTATRIRRLKDNASDAHLEIITPTDIHQLLKQIPRCKAIITTGQKATDIIREQTGADNLSAGEKTSFESDGRELFLYRMPSSSRAYPLGLEKKATFYKLMLRELGIIQ